MSPLGPLGPVAPVSPLGPVAPVSPFLTVTFEPSEKVMTVLPSGSVVVPVIVTPEPSLPS